MSDYRGRTNARWSRKISQVERMSGNSSIFDQSEKAKQDGVEASYKNAENTWKAKAGEALVKVANNMQYFTSEDVRLLVDKWGYKTSDNRAMGAIMQSAKRAGLAEPTDNFPPSKIKSNHKRPVRQYKSRVYKP